MTDAQKLEQLMDLVADALIQSADAVPNSNVVRNAQKFIRGGIIANGRQSATERMVLYQKDIRANEEDLNNLITTETDEVIPELQEIANLIFDYDSGDDNPDGFAAVQCVVNPGSNGTITISLQGGMFTSGTKDITSLITGDGNPLNVSQFIPMELSSSIVDVEQAEEYLDTTIYELLPTGDTRQDRIIRFFQELNALLPPNAPTFNSPVIRDEHLDWTGMEAYSQQNSISYAQDNPGGSANDEEDSYIHRLNSSGINNSESNSIPNATNAARTIQDIYNTIKPYLEDILEEPPTLPDERPQYQNESNGYLKFRNPNQGIIIRNTNQEYIEGLNPNPYSGQEYLNTGFTITMWVRFLDKTSEGTLFNFGNPTRQSNPMGFKLETYVLSADTPTTLDSNPTFDSLSGWTAVTTDKNPNGTLFENTDVERFVRLVLYEPGISEDAPGKIRDSYTCSPHIDRQQYHLYPGNPTDNGSALLGMLTATRIPIDFNEWYFICASYNPNVYEDESFEFLNENGEPFYDRNYKFWMNQIDPTSQNVVVDSLYGNRCKVEMISRTDLLRARGYKV